MERLLTIKDNKRKISPLLFILIGLIISALLGIFESQLLLGKPQQYRENMFWKYTVLFYFLTIIYTLWFYFSENYLPILINLLKFIGVTILLSLPYFTVLALTGVVSTKIVLTILPAQVVFLAGVFIWHVATETDPDLEKDTTKITLKGGLLVIITVFTTGLFGLSDLMVLFLGSLSVLGYSLLLLQRAKKNQKSSAGN